MKYIFIILLFASSFLNAQILPGSPTEGRPRPGYGLPLNLRGLTPPDTGMVLISKLWRGRQPAPFWEYNNLAGFTTPDFRLTSLFFDKSNQTLNAVVTDGETVIPVSTSYAAILENYLRFDQSNNISNTIFVSEDANTPPLRNSIIRPFQQIQEIVDSLQNGDNVEIFPGEYTFTSPYTFPENYLANNEVLSYNIKGNTTINATNINVSQPLWSDGGTFATAQKRNFSITGENSKMKFTKTAGSFSTAFAFHNVGTRIKINVDSVGITGGRVWGLHIGCNEANIKVNELYTQGGILLTMWETLDNSGFYTGTQKRKYDIKIGKAQADGVSDALAAIRFQNASGGYVHKDSLSLFDVEVGELTLNSNNLGAFMFSPAEMEDCKMNINIDKLEYIGANPSQTLQLSTESGTTPDDTLKNTSLSIKIGSIIGSSSVIMNGGNAQSNDGMNLNNSIVNIDIGNATFGSSGGFVSVRHKDLVNNSRFNVNCDNCVHDTGVFLAANSTDQTDTSSYFEFSGSYTTLDNSTVLTLTNSTSNIILSARLYNSTMTNLVTASSPRTIIVTGNSNVTSANVGPNITVVKY